LEVKEILFCPTQRLKTGEKLNALIKWLLLGFFIQALPQSNFNPETSCWLGVLCFSLVHPANGRAAFYVRVYVHYLILGFFYLFSIKSINRILSNGQGNNKK
jgi:hypothetical protein